MNSWDIALLVGAVYLAVVTLVRMMRCRRDTLVAEMRQQIQAEQQRQQATKKKAKRQDRQAKKAA